MLRIDPRGALKFNEFFKQSQSPFDAARLLHFYIVPPDITELTRRLYERDLDPKKVAKRLEAAMSDLPFAANAHYLLVSETNRIEDEVLAVNSVLQSFAR